MASERRSLPPGLEPWDPANGLRVGALSGGLVGALVIALTGFTHFWVIAVTGLLGGAVGFWSEKRKQRRPTGHDETIDR